MSLIPKPAGLFDRDYEWSRLTSFVDSPGDGTRLGVVYGRRRQGKTTLLEALCAAAGGFYWQAREREPAQNLASLGEAWQAFNGGLGPSRFSSWTEALRVLSTAGLARSATIPVVLDEIGYLIARDGSFASELQAVLSPRGDAVQAGRTRLILCGSAFGQMRSLLDADAPLRGRAGLELVVQPFDYRTAAEFWGLRANPDAAFRLHSLVGGTPAYIDLAAGHRPLDGNIDRWAIERLLDPSSALFREGRLAVAEDQQLRDGQLYWAMLAAISGGAHRWSELSETLGGKQGAMTHALNVLIDAGWVERTPDPLRDRRSRVEVVEPIVRLSQLIIERFDSRLQRPGNATAVWNDAQPIVRRQIYAPHLERLARLWLRDFATVDAGGGVIDEAGQSELPGVGQIDLVGIERATSGARCLVAIGEVKSGLEPVGVGELARLDQIAAQLATFRSRAVRALRQTEPRRIIVARGGFTADLRRDAARRGDVELVDLHQLYDSGA